MENSYVISVKKIRDYYGKPLSEEKQCWEYARDDTGGSYCSGYPCWSCESGAKTFASVESAKKYYSFAREYLITKSNLDKYDWNTFAIRKRIYTKIEELV